MDFPPHPLALLGHRNGALGMKAGDRVVYRLDGRHGRADEFTSDGEAFITWDDGTYGTVKWNHLDPEPPAERGSEEQD